MRETRNYAALRVEALGEKSVQKINDIHRVSQGARSLGRLIKEARAKKPLVSMDTLMKPENFDLVVATTKAMSVEKEKPVLTLPRYIGNLLGHIIQIKIGHALRSNDEIKCDEATKFQRLMSAEWNFRVNSAAVKKLNVTKRNQVQAVPLTDDLVRLREYILTEMEEEMTQLQKSKSAQVFTKLAKLTMSRLILFNKRRRAEVKDLKVTDYMNRPDWRKDQGMELALSPMDKSFANR